MSTLQQRINYAFRTAQLKKSGVTQRALAKAVGISPPSVHQWFSGKTLSLDMVYAQKAAEYLECDPLWLSTGYVPSGANNPNNPNDFDLPQLYPTYSDKFRAMDAHYQRIAMQEKAGAEPIGKQPSALTAAMEDLLSKRKGMQSEVRPDAIQGNATVMPNKGTEREQMLWGSLQPLKRAIPYLNDDEKKEFLNLLQQYLLEKDEGLYFDYLKVLDWHIQNALAKEHRELEATPINEIREKLQSKFNKLIDE